MRVSGGWFWWSNKKQAATAGKSPTDTTTKMLSIPDGDFQEISEKKLTGEVIDLRRDSGKWRIAEPQQIAADQDSVSSMVGNLSNLNADKVIEEKAADLKPYGLDIPTLDIVVTKKDGKTAEVLVGDDVPTGSGAYAKLANDPRVFTIGSFVKTGLDKKPDDLRDKRLLTFDSDKLTRVELQAKGQTIEFGKNSSNEWQILKPQPLRADSSQVDTLVSKLKDAKMDLANPDADAAKKFAAGSQDRASPSVSRFQPAPRLSKYTRLRTKTRRTTPRVPQSQASTRCPPILATRSIRPATTSATKSSSISASAIPTGSRSRESPTPRTGTSGCRAPRRWTTPASRT